MEDLECRVSSFFDTLTNTVPFQFYISADRGGLGNDDTIDSYWGEVQRKGKPEKKSRLQRTRYDPSNWRCTSDVIFQTASSNFEPRERPTQKSSKQSNSEFSFVHLLVVDSHGLKRVPLVSGKSTIGDISRDDLRQRLHAKIAALQQQQLQQKKSKKYTKEEIKAFRAERRAHGNKDFSKNSSLVKEDLKTNFTFNQIVSKGTPSEEKRKEEVLVESGVKVAKRRRMMEALKSAGKKERERVNWSPEKREEVERKEAYDNAILRASGEKVFDDLKKIKKALKVRDQKIAKSVRNRNERKKAVEEKQKETSDRRTKNILERIDKIKSKSR